MNFNYPEKLKKKYSWLITGVAGFIGSNLLEFLQKNNQFVIGVDDLSTGKKKNIFKYFNSKNFFFIKKNISILKLKDFKNYKFDFVIHLAAISSVQKSFLNTNLLNKTNNLGFKKILKICIKKKINKFIYASSSAVYGDQSIKVNEQNKLTPLSPYAKSKLGNELLVAKMNKINFLCYGLRLFNIFGKNQDHKSKYAAVIPKWISLLKKNKQIEIFGNGKNTRDFCHVDNVIHIIMLLCFSKYNKSDVFNVGTGRSMSLLSLAKIMFKYFKIKAHKKYIKFTSHKRGDIKYSDSDISKAKKILHYNPVSKTNKKIRDIILS